MSVCELVKIYYLWRPGRARSLASCADAGSLVNLVDEGDNYLVELAIAGNAEILLKIFNDRSLNSLNYKLNNNQEII